jgi:hemolysin D
MKSAKAAKPAQAAQGAAADRAVVPFPNVRQRRDREQLAFLPAALEIVETPPNPIGRAIAVSIIALFCLALAWAAFGRIDIVATAPGKIVATGRTKIIQPFETGVVRAIHVRDGQTVKAGDVLVELDPTIVIAERNHFQSDLIAAQLDIARLKAALSDADDPVHEFRPPENAAADLVAMQRQFLDNQVTEQHAKVAALDHQKAQKEAERAAIGATIAKLEASIGIIQQRVDIRSALFKKELGSKLVYLETLQLLVEQQHELAVQKNRALEAEAAVAAMTETHRQTIAEFRRGLSDELAKAEAKAGGLTHDVAKAEQRIKLQTLAAPVNGVVQQLAIHTVGGVVTPAQALLVVVPVDSHLEIEAMVSNRDIGFAHEGQDVEIKVDTFNFTRYGLLHGKVLGVSQDAITRDKPSDRSNEKAPGAETSTSEPKGQELSYAARISLDRTQMHVEDRLVNLSLGMAVTTEIKTGSRTVLSYLLSPILKYKQETLRER